MAYHRSEVTCTDQSFVKHLQITARGHKCLLRMTVQVPVTAAGSQGPALKTPKIESMGANSGESVGSNLLAKVFQKRDFEFPTLFSFSVSGA